MSSTYAKADEISLSVSPRHWAALAAGCALALLAIPMIDARWRLFAGGLWALFGAASAASLWRRRWRRLVWQPSGALRLESACDTRRGQLGRASYASRRVIVLHMTRGRKSWYFLIFRGDQPDAFRRCASRLRQAGRLFRIN